MTAPNNADYERGWQDAIASLHAPKAAERAALNEAAVGLVRRFASAMDHYARDMDRVARAMAAMDVGPDEARRIEDAAWASIELHGNWRWLTRNMTTEQKTAAADAVERHWDLIEADDPGLTHEASREEVRWWLK